MSQEFQILELLFLATVAGFIGYRLWAALGRRTGNERRRDPFPAREQVTEPRTAREKGETGAANDRSPASAGLASDQVPAGSALGQTLTEIQLADRTFEIPRFLSGARGAYGLIVKAFAQGDKAALRPLVSIEVFQSFSEVIDGRAARGERVEIEVVSIKDAKITGAKLEGRAAEITVTFEAELISVTKNSDGAVIAGDPAVSVHVIDIWTFARDVKAKSPDWTLTATDTGE